ncbi:rhomboid-like protein [Streptomyces sp. NPDC006530]|uniref:rhomboid-like protein n=1 Tax=Streptomyces sp. NPDC006530 TaxID=3364750 RepID=UPI0036ACA4B7
MTTLLPRGAEHSRPVRSWVRSTPGTHIWLLVIAITSLVIQLSTRDMEHFLLHRNSSNIHELTKHPVQALFTSAFWIENPSSLLLYLVLFEIVHGTVERWLGTLRWLCTVVVGHVVATLISQEYVLWSIQNQHLPKRLAHAMSHVVDIGVSYGLAASAGVLVHRLPHPWRWLYLVGLAAFFGIPLAGGGTFTDLGHVTALVIGLACWPLTRDVPPRKPVAPNDRAGHSG